MTKPQPLEFVRSYFSKMKSRNLIKKYFEVDFYDAYYPYPEGREKSDAIDDYLTDGWLEGRDPAKWFSTDFYICAHPDVTDAGVNPFVHYIRSGKEEEREISPSSVDQNNLRVGGATRLPTPRKDDRRSARKDGAIAIIAANLDAEFYLSTYPDLGAADVDAVDHYNAVGWREGRDPAPWFSSRGYLELHPDVRQKGINPFLHYLTLGRKQGLAIHPARFPHHIPFSFNPSVANPKLLDMARYTERKAAPARNGFNPSGLDIHWVVPDFSPGGGGHMTIFRMVRFLEFFGHTCTIWIHHDLQHAKAAGAYDDIVKHYQPIRGQVRSLSNELFELSGDVIIATDWMTVYPVSHCVGFLEKFYFVQDFEPAFFPTGSESIGAELTYAKDLACVCASPWLEKKISKEFGRWCRSFWLAYDPEVYYRRPRRTADAVPRIAAYFRPHTARRVADFLLIALSELAKTTEFHADFFGSAEALAGVPFSATNHGVLDETRMSELYNECDLGICFSSTNYSLIPQEMMACGLPVVEMNRESTRDIFPPEIITLAGPEPAHIARDIEKLLKDPEARARQAEKGLEWVRQFSWEASARDVENALVARLTERGWTASHTSPVENGGVFDARTLKQDGQQEKVVRQSPVRRIKASVIIPTYNAGKSFPKLIDAIRKQRSPWSHEIVVIDSSSSDGTAEYCASQEDLVFLQIPKEEFSHGGTRNRAIAASSGEYVALLTQDAYPVDDYWLYNFIILLEHYPKAAGAFGKHYAWPTASPFVRRDLKSHFDSFDARPLVIDKDTSPESLGVTNETMRDQILYFFSDNNSCLRREVWEKIPYPVVDYGEDQLWARDIVKAGYEKAYSPKSIVYHSHDYTFEENFERAVIEAAFFSKHFGWKVLSGSPEDALAAQNRYDETWARANGLSQDEIQRQSSLSAARFFGNSVGLAKAGMAAAAPKTSN